MHLIMAREAMDTHFKLVMPILMPKGDQKAKKWSYIAAAAKFYLGWYPKVWMPPALDFNVSHLSPANREHLTFAAKTCKRLARTLFHTMGKYKEKLEFEQLILANFVDIGVDLFVMGCVLANTEHLLAQNKNDQSPQELADLFCENARKRIEANFRAVKENHNRSFNKVADSLMSGKYRWLSKDVFEDLPRAYRNYADNLPQSTAAEDLAKTE
jgi:hypothetical protein